MKITNRTPLPKGECARLENMGRTFVFFMLALLAAAAMCLLN